MVSGCLVASLLSLGFDVVLPVCSVCVIASVCWRIVTCAGVLLWVCCWAIAVCGDFLFGFACGWVVAVCWGGFRLFSVVWVWYSFGWSGSDGLWVIVSVGGLCSVARWFSCTDLVVVSCVWWLLC